MPWLQGQELLLGPVLWRQELELAVEASCSAGRKQDDRGKP